MKTIARAALVAMIALLPAPIVLAQDHQHMDMGSSPADKAMMSGMDRMDRDMAAAPMTGDADHDFVAMMIPHHQGAVDMAEVELKYGKDPAMRKLAREIIASQKKEIALMKAWLTRHETH